MPPCHLKPKYASVVQHFILQTNQLAKPNSNHVLTQGQPLYATPQHLLSNTKTPRPTKLIRTPLLISKYEGKRTFSSKHQGTEETILAETTARTPCFKATDR
ncbi:hypothetical protein Pyn_30253 [Prunus yedoensis var. nudiflora]|uniref:Uncharacterized protein n=1 Tax=Prunus yedoensis var. nudiflora TaxID=2094558 RepID=A0A314U7R4_PRUYE|nr:hypothetical protein Pyn_30253 [Prunus yedoensis var. nudiflora]